MFPEEDSFRGPFSSQLQELSKTIISIEELVQKTINKYTRQDQIEEPEPNVSEFNKQIEGLHLKDTSFFGECDHRKQQIEAAISQRLDVQGFQDIAKRLQS